MTSPSPTRMTLDQVRHVLTQLRWRYPLPVIARRAGVDVATIINIAIGEPVSRRELHAVQVSFAQRGSNLGLDAWAAKKRGIPANPEHVSTALGRVFAGMAAKVKKDVA